MQKDQIIQTTTPTCPLQSTLKLTCLFLLNSTPGRPATITQYQIAASLPAREWPLASQPSSKDVSLLSCRSSKQEQ